MYSYEIKIRATTTHTALISAEDEDYLDDEVVDHLKRLGYDVNNLEGFDFDYDILEVYPE